MSGSKRAYEDWQAAGCPPRSSDRAVCAAHFVDDALADAAERLAHITECDYCGRKSSRAIAIPLVELVEQIILPGILQDYDDAIDSLPWDGREGGYQGATTYTSDELVWDLAQEISEESQILDDLVGSLPDWTWCARDPFRLTGLEFLSYGWEHFCRRVKHERRYFFLREAPVADGLDDPDPPATPQQLLDRVLASSQDLEMVRSMPIPPLFRARHQKPGEQHLSALDIGPPPPTAARANRMSPAGIPMMYLAQDPETALTETANAPGCFAIGQFEFERHLTLLDLSALPLPPSRFDLDRSQIRDVLAFLRDFRKDLLKPVDRDGQEHIEYVPSQVVTEYLRIAELKSGGRLDGIAYESIQNPGHMAYVLFADQSALHLSEQTQGAVHAPASTFNRTNRWIRMTHRWEITVSAKNLTSKR